MGSRHQQWSFWGYDFDDHYLQPYWWFRKYKMSSASVSFQCKPNEISFIGARAGLSETTIPTTLPECPGVSWFHGWNRKKIQHSPRCQSELPAKKRQSNRFLFHQRLRSPTGFSAVYHSEILALAVFHRLWRWRRMSICQNSLTAWLQKICVNNTIYTYMLSIPFEFEGA